MAPPRRKGRVDVREAPSRRTRQSADVPVNGRHLSQHKQTLYDQHLDARAKAVYDNLTAGSKRTIESISGGPLDASSTGSNNAVQHDVDWVDDDDSMPLDVEMELSAEGDEGDHLREYAGRSTKRGTYQSWSDRIRKADRRWAEQLPMLIDAYLQFQHSPVDVGAAGLETFTLPAIDVYDFAHERTFYHLPDCPTLNVTFLRQGFLGSSPLEVHSVISLRTLELYRRLRFRQPRVSIQAWIHVICDFHNLTYQRTYWQHFSDTFDIYLKILAAVQARVDEELQRNSPNWRVLHSCPPCQYKLLEDPTLDVSMIGALDGNQSLKRVRLRVGLEADPRAFDSSYYISEDQVNHFRYDIRPRAKTSTTSTKNPLKIKIKIKKPNDVDSSRDVWGPDANQATPADGDDEETTCTERWKAAMSDSHKRMWAIYRETGIFLSACRHGIVWWICDMVESGELAKYPLAIVNNVLNVLGMQVGMGYDIGCSFSATIAKSTLSAAAKQKDFRLIVNAFHGYAHRRPCQLRHHPLYVKGFGIEDAETCERIFSSFNGLAIITRYASRFHRHQAIDAYARAWDETKYEELSTFLLNNYRQVEQILTELPVAIAALQSGKTREDMDYHKHLEAECIFLDSRKKETAEDAFACEYIEILIQHRAAKALFDRVIAQIDDPPRDSNLRGQLSLARNHAHENLQTISDVLQHFEVKHNISARWTPDSDQWKNAAGYLATREYQKALSKLEGLVVQRLFELAKMGLSGTAYKLRTHINKSLKTRCRAIQNALRKYNSAAKAIGRPELEWKDVSTYGSLAEFELLRESRDDIRALPWADSANRQAAVHTLRIERAKEERDRLNVEIRRLNTWMRDEEHLLDCCIAALRESSPLLAAELSVIKARRLRVNRIHHARLEIIYALPAFTGSRNAGSAVEIPAEPDSHGESHTTPILPELGSLDVDSEAAGADEDDWAGEQLEGLNTFFGNLTLLSDDED